MRAPTHANPTAGRGKAQVSDRPGGSIRGYRPRGREARLRGLGYIPPFSPSESGRGGEVVA